MAEDRPSLCSIPPELLELILTYTDEGPRSKSDVVYDQPTLNFISCRYKHPPLKSLSRVSRGFRQLLLHRVFQHTIQLVTAEDRLVERQVDGSKYSEWPMCKFYSFINFIDEKELNHVVQTFTLAIKAQPQFDVLEYHDNGRQSQLTEYNSRWRLLLLSLMPMIRQVTIIAPPTVLGVLAGVPVGPESIIKLHMPYQLLSLWRTTCNWKQVAEDTDPEEAYEKHSLFMLYAWTGLLLNEGSFLRAHAPSRFPSTNWQNNVSCSAIRYHLYMAILIGLISGIRY